VRKVGWGGGLTGQAEPLVIRTSSE